MDKSHTEKLKDFEKEIQKLKDKLQDLEEKLQLLKEEAEAAPAEDAEVDFTGIEIGEVDIPAPDVTAYRWGGPAPAHQVHNIRSGISLQDRARFIGGLFKENVEQYETCLSALNGMENLTQAATYLFANFPEWDYDSQEVYDLMMAARKKLG